MNSESSELNSQAAKEKRQSNKRVDSMIGYVTTVCSACLILMWSVFNAWLNVLQYRAALDAEADLVRKIGDEGPSWGITGLMVLLTCVVPFLLGVFLLFRTINGTKKNTR